MKRAIPFGPGRLRLLGFLALLCPLAPFALGACSGNADGPAPWLRLARLYREPAQLPSELSAAGRGSEVDGTHRIQVGDFSGEGFLVHPELGAEVELPAGAGGSLRFYLVGNSAPVGEAPAVERARFALHDGEAELWSAVVAVRHARGGWHTARVPEARHARTLAFTVAADGPVRAGFFAPTLGPAEPSPPAKPDGVLFLVDTFRADNLSIHGGHGQAPELDRLAGEARRFLSARATASWTLPSQASMLTGLYPAEHGATRSSNAIPGAAVTIAEHLSEFGYRTGAVTDSACVSHPFGFSQGFAWFEEFRGTGRDLGRTLASARRFLDQADGRPAFLFVQTYRTHHPYRTGPDETLADWKAFCDEHWAGRPILRMWAGDHDAGDELRVDFDDAELLSAFRALYDQGVHGFDAEFGAWFEALRADGLLERTNFVLTSDHGESFGLHGGLLHTGPMWDELVHVPLLLWGPGIAPGDERTPVSLIDLPATFAALAGLDPDPSWRGHSLLELPEERAILGFMGEAYMAVDGPRKVFALADADSLAQGEHYAAFDLAADPDELNSLSDASWAREQVLALAERVREILAARLEEEGAQLSSEDRAGLQALGYVDE